MGCGRTSQQSDKRINAQQVTSPRMQNVYVSLCKVIVRNKLCLKQTQLSLFTWTNLHFQVTVTVPVILNTFRTKIHYLSYIFQTIFQDPHIFSRCLQVYNS
jgi:hypothetical protein